MATKAIPVVAAKVAATQSNFPVYIKPSSMTGWTTLSTTEANSIRFYSDESLTTELAREVYGADEFYVKVPSLTTTTTIYADYDGIRSDYATSATYGRDNVWTGFLAVYHLGEASGNAIDATGNYNLTDNGTVGTGTGKVGNARDFTPANSEYFTNGSTAFNLNDLTITGWVNPDAIGITNNILGKMGGSGDRGYNWRINTDNKMAFNTYVSNSGDFTNTAGTISASTWTHIGVTRTSGAKKLFLSGTQSGSTSTQTGTLDASAQGFSLGEGFGSGGSGGSYFDGGMDEFRIATSVFADTWITTEYNNLDNVGAFWGTVTDAGGGGITKPNYLGFSRL